MGQLFILLVGLFVIACSGLTAKEAIPNLGRGINLGNSWDGGGNGPTDPNTVNTILDKLKADGFGHVRFTVTWSFGDNPQPQAGTVDGLKQCISHALGIGFYVVLNWHWNHPPIDNLGGFIAGWRTIAGNYFKDAPFNSRKLIFEVLNEPNYNNITTMKAVNYAGYNTIRTIDATRIVLIMPDNQGGWWALNAGYPDDGSLPGGGHDSFLAINVHSYDPWNFAGQGDEGAYPGCNFYVNIANTLNQWKSKTGVAITLNEFGLTGQPGRDSTNDHCYLSLMSNLLERVGIAPAVWNDYGSFGIIDNQGNKRGGNIPVVLGGCINSCGCC